jgi:hypothetical protein
MQQPSPAVQVPTTEADDVTESDDRKSENVKHRRAASVCVVGVMAIIAASCSSNSASNETTSSIPQATTTTTPPATGVSTTTAQNAQSFGHIQTVTGPAGQKLTAIAGTPQHIGYSVGGPPGSWAMGFTIKNLGPGTFGWDPSAQVTLADSSGRVSSPQVSAAAVTTTGKPATLAVGQQLPVLLVFVLGSGAQPKTASFSPFGTSVAPVKWSS